MKKKSGSSASRKSSSRRAPTRGNAINEKRRRASSNEAKPAEWELRLYVAGNTPNSISAFSNLKQICETHMGGRYRIEIIDLLRNPQLASGDQIIAIPTLVRRLPTPIKKIIGDLSNRERVLIGLDLKPA